MDEIVVSCHLMQMEPDDMPGARLEMIYTDSQQLCLYSKEETKVDCSNYDYFSCKTLDTFVISRETSENPPKHNVTGQTPRSKNK
jgi:hypothetical protein